MNDGLGSGRSPDDHETVIESLKTL